METKDKPVVTTTKKSDLISKLNTFNTNLSVSRAIKNKYIYPDDLKELKSTDKRKKSYRRQLQKNILYFLSIVAPTKEQKDFFNDFCKTFIMNFESLNKIEIDSIYSFHNEKEKQEAIKILTLYKQVK